MTRISVFQGLGILALLLLLSGCNSTNADSLDFDRKYWQSEVARLTALGCDMTSEAAGEYRRCILEEMISDYNEDGSVGEWK